MQKNPELSIKVGVDPQIDSSKLKTDIETAAGKMKEKPVIPAKLDTKGFAQSIQSEIGGPYPIEIEPKFKTDLGTEIANQISQIKEEDRKIDIKLDLEGFNNDLNETLKESLKNVNKQLSYYLKNLTANSASLESVVDGLFPKKGISNAVQRQLNVIQKELVVGLNETSKKIKPFNQSDLFKDKDGKTTTSLSHVITLFKNLETSIHKITDGEEVEIPLNVDKFKSNVDALFKYLDYLKKNLNKDSIANKLNDYDFDTEDFLDNLSPVLTALEKMGLEVKNLDLSNLENIGDFLNNITTFANDESGYIDDFCNNAISNLSNLTVKINDIMADQKTAMQTTLETSKALSQAMGNDESDYLNASEIEIYGQKLDEVLKNIADRQKSINDERQKAVDLENGVLVAARLTRDGLSEELTKYDALFKKYDTDKISKFADSVNLAEFIKNQEAKMQGIEANGEDHPIENGVYKVTDVIFNIEPEALQLKVDALFKDITAPIGEFKMDEAIANAKSQLEKALGTVDLSNVTVADSDSKTEDSKEKAVSIPGKIVITDADVVVDVKNPVAIPGKTVVSPTSVQFENSEDLEKNSKAIESANKNLQGIVNKTSNYATNVAAIGPSFQYVTQEVDNLNRALETQIIDFNRISEQTNAYVGKTRFISIDSSNVTVSGEPTPIDGKVTLTKDDIVPPETPIKIPGHVTLEVKDITPPSDPVELQGKITKTTTESGSKGKKKKDQDTEKPEVVELNGHVKLEDNDIERPDPVKLNGAVKIKDSDIKVGDIEISKKKFDINGNLILKNAEILDAIKGNSSSGNKNKSATAKKASINNPGTDTVSSLLGELKNIDDMLPNVQNQIDSTIGEAKEENQVWFELLRNRREEISKLLAEKDPNAEKNWEESRRGRYATEDNSHKREQYLSKESVKATQEQEAAENSLIVAEQKREAEEDALHQKQSDQAYLDYLNEIVSTYKELTSLESKRGRLTKPEDKAELERVNEEIKQEEENLTHLWTTRDGYSPIEGYKTRSDPSKFKFVKKQMDKYQHAKDYADEKFTTAEEVAQQKKLNEKHDQYIKDLRTEVSLEKDLRDGKDKYGSDSDYVKQTEADLKALKQKNRDYEHSVGYEFLSQDQDWIDLTTKKRNQRLQYRAASVPKKEKQQEFLSAYDEYAKQKNTSLSITDPDVLKVYEKQLEEKAEKLSDDYEKLVEILSPEELDAFLERLRKKVQTSEDKMEITKANLESEKNDETSKQVSKLSKSIGDAKSSYNLNKENLDVDSLSDTQKAILNADEAVSKIQTLTAGTDEYTAAVENANQKWREAELLIQRDVKAQNDLTNSVDKISKKFAQLSQDVADTSNESLKNSIKDIQDRAFELSKKNPNTYENYSEDFYNLRRDSYNVEGQYNAWRNKYKKLEKEGQKIAAGVESARLMQQDGTLTDVDFTSVDKLLKELDKLEPKTDAYKSKLDEVKQVWAEIKKKVDDVEEAEDNLAKNDKLRINGIQNIQNKISQVTGKIEDTQGKKNGVSQGFYSKLIDERSDFTSLLNSVKNSTDPNEAAKKWATNKWGEEEAKSIHTLSDAINQLISDYKNANNEYDSFKRKTTQETSFNKAATEIANLKSMLRDYLSMNKKIQGSELEKPFKDLFDALNADDAPARVGELKKRFAELRAESKRLGLETTSLADKFEKLFGQHFSTMIVMGALHQMQNATRVIYQNVVQIDTAMTELRKVTNLTSTEYSEFMSRAAGQAKSLGVSISDYINSTADWSRLGYDEKDAENLATYSTLLKNVGDGIDDVSTASSYLISTLRGFGLLADDAQDVVDKIDAVANTQPVTANDIGEILTRSAAAMSAANNTLEETIALGTAANSVIQDADSVGTVLKTLSMYLRASKTDAEAAGIEVDGMADSVSKLRSELKSLTGVDIMASNKEFKSTYQIMKELSQVWGSLSDVTQANVTEMLAGKRNSNAVSAILNNFSVAESSMESAANSANVAWEENEKYLDSIQGRLDQLDSTFQVLSQDVLHSDVVKQAVSFLTSIVEKIDDLINTFGALPTVIGLGVFVTQLGEPKMTGFMIVPSNTPGGDTEQARCSFYWRSCAREYLVKPTNMAA